MKKFVTDNNTTTLLDLFVYQQTTHPDKIALTVGNKHFSYTQLNKLANQMANLLESKHHLRKGDVVGICFNTSEWTIISILALLKLGCIYLPIDLDYPRQRINYIIDDSEMKLLLTGVDVMRDYLKPKTYPCPYLFMEEITAEMHQSDTSNPEVSMLPSDKAYIMYTSGTTGIPNGVVITHQGILRLVKSDFLPYEKELTFMLLAPIGFDASTFEIWGALLSGNRLVVYPVRLPEFEHLGRIITQQGVNCLWLTASLFNLIIDESPDILQGVSYLLTGGERLSAHHIKKAQELLPHTQFINGYGPTECTTFACCYLIPDIRNTDTTSIPIGTPIADTEIFILDKNKNPVKKGEKGELYIAGAGLATEYLHNPVLTSQRFILHRFQDGVFRRLYKTGDWCKELPNGAIDFIGRIDQQLKINGHRVEVKEIELAIQKHEAVNQCIIVTTGENEKKKLIAFVKTGYSKSGNDDSVYSSTIDVHELKASLSEWLPAYMIPNKIIELAYFPTTVNGKTDYKKLLSLLQASGNTKTELKKSDLANNPIEETLIDIWQTILQQEDISVEDNFFDLGGSSIEAIKMVHAISRKFHVELSAQSVFEASTIKEFAELIENYEEKNDCVVKIRCGKGNPIFLPPGIGGNAFFFKELIQKLKPDCPLYVLEYPIDKDGRLLTKTIPEMAQFFISEIKKIQPEGAYNFIGFSLGGRVAYDIALNLQKQGDKIGLLCLIDAEGSFMYRSSNKAIREATEELYLLLKLPWKQKKIYLTKRIPFLFRLMLPRDKPEGQIEQKEEVMRTEDYNRFLYETWIAFDTYKPLRKLKGDMLLIKRSEKYLKTHRKMYFVDKVSPDLYHKANMSDGEITIVSYDCSHTGFFDEPVLSQMLDNISDYIAYGKVSGHGLSENI